ncbi:MAG: anaerobic ribonucleoside-triphosphate reductase activating protein [Solobacterium sp.]|nr:anaerobic ribonucleoside-triphosphate reductase activating protein [Solobacterium sp.]
MAQDGNFLISLSVLYRNTMKFFDKALAKYEIGSGQLMFLFFINEHEGITMQEVSRIGEVDKGTTTKSIQKLIEQDYVQVRTDENDRRVKRLYTTQRAAEIMNELYDLRNEYRSLMARGVEMESFEDALNQVCENSRNLNPEPRYQGIKIGGMQKVTLLDYPGKAAAAVFTGGCNFKCPFCHNKELVFLPDNYEFFPAERVLEYLEKRRGLLDGVCISGGEPLIQDGLEEFIEAIREMGYLVKLDTNGYYPEKLEEIVHAGLVDYVAMDLKNTREKYAETVGLNPEVFQIDRIERSIEFLMHGSVEYEFRTTVVRELHTKEDLQAMAKRIQGARHYYLQQYQDSGSVIQPGWTAYNAEEMADLLSAVKEYVPDTELRGVK